MFWTMLNDPLVRFAEWMYDKFGNLYSKIAKSVFGKVGVTDLNDV